MSLGKISFMFKRQTSTLRLFLICCRFLICDLDGISGIACFINISKNTVSGISVEGGVRTTTVYETDIV